MDFGTIIALICVVLAICMVIAAFIQAITKKLATKTRPEIKNQTISPVIETKQPANQHNEFLSEQSPAINKDGISKKQAASENPFAPFGVYEKNETELLFENRFFETGIKFEYMRFGNPVTETISDSCTIIGSDTSICDIVLEQDNIGKCQALIFEKRGRFYIVNLDIENAVYVNNEELVGMMLLNNATNLKFANAIIRTSIIK